MTEPWFHCTDEAGAQSILAHGFCRAHNWFARRAKDALAVGRGQVLLAVEFKAMARLEEDGSPAWQMCVHEHIPPEHVHRALALQQEEEKP